MDGRREKGREGGRKIMNCDTLVNCSRITTRFVLHSLIIR